MSVYLSQEALRGWADSKTWYEGRQIFIRGGITELALDDPVLALVHVGTHAVRTRFRIHADGTVESHCPCKRNQEYGVICEHVVAAGFAVADLTEDTRRERRLRIEHRMAAERRNGAAARPKRLPAGTPGAIPAALRLRLPPDWVEQLDCGVITMECQVELLGTRKRIDRLPANRLLAFSEHDRYLLYVLEDLTHTTACPGMLAFDRETFLELLSEVAPGTLWVAGEPDPLRLDPEPALSCLTVRLDTTDGTLSVDHGTEPPGRLVVAGRKSGWVQSGRTLYPLAAMLPNTLRRAYEGPLRVLRANVFTLLYRELPAMEDRFVIVSEVSPERFTVTEGCPGFMVDFTGTTERLDVHLQACYGETLRPASPRPDTSDRLPVPGEPLHYVQRNAAAEAAALTWFCHHFELGEDDHAAGIVLEGPEQTLRALAGSVPAIRRKGWQVRFAGEASVFSESAEWVYPELCVGATEHPDWFTGTVSFIDRDGKRPDSSAVETALRTGQSFLADGNRLLLVNTMLLNNVLNAFAECAVQRDGMELIHRMHAGFLSGMLDTIDGARLVAPPEWEQHARVQRRQAAQEAADIPEPLVSQLRPYQRDGVNWLRFCERCGYAGILADEMGLGKTVQALAWVQLARLDEALRRLPALVVCPTSLVHNWEREAARFVPGLTRHIVSGPNRYRTWGAVESSDLVFTSYSLLRRDIERYRELRFSIAILDEAQHIKNRSTQNAIAAKRINARHRLVLTGTPIENSVSDLWSIMEFLQPGYLGTHGRFAIRFERPISAGGAAAEHALELLRQKMEPFMLRRLKTAVAADLPPKVTRLATCRMGRAQRREYDRLLSRYHDSLAELVDRQGYDRSRFSVFTALLRLRQMCCHPALLRDHTMEADIPSAKVELFFELLDEAMDGGHRVLVFSQFVRMLHILRRALDRRQIRYAYLDGSTRDRLAQVDAFNNTPEIPVFLVSLKAGGSGLNLTGADIVIHFDPWWNPAVEDQATDRTHRIGQTRTVYSIKLITEGTIEEKVLELQTRKRGVINAAISSAGSIERQLSWDDIRDVLGMDAEARVKPLHPGH